MTELAPLGRMLIFFGVLLVVMGLAVTLAGRLHLPRLPGDIYIQRGNFVFYFPLATGLLLSAVLTILLNLFFFARR